MRRRLRRAPALLVALAVLGGVLPLQACWAQTVGSVLRIAVLSFPQDLFPIGASTVEMFYLRGFVGRSLTIYDKSWAVACALCTELPTLENGGAKIVTRPDGSKGIDVTFTLDPGLAWDDGTPVTSADVLFSIEIAHKLGAGASALPNILDAVALDDHHVMLRIASVRFDYNRMEELFLLPAHREKPSYESAASPADYKSHSLYIKDPSAPGLSYGPFKIDKTTPDEIVLARNPYWHGRQPSFDRIVLRKFADTATIAAEMIAKRIDMGAGDISLDIDSVYRMEAMKGGTAFNFIFKSTLWYGHVDINLSNPLLKDKSLRRAMLLGLDRPIMSHMRERQAEDIAPSSFLPPDSPNFDPTLKPAPFDPAQAAALLDSAGYARGADGIRADSQGKRLAFRLAGQLDFEEIRPIVETMRAQWRTIGIEIAIDDKRMSEFLPKRQFDLAFYSWNNSPEFLLEPVYGVSGIPTAANGNRGLNFPGFDNDEMNRVVSSLTVEMNPARRLLLWRRAQQIYAEELPALPISFGTQVYVVPSNMVGIEPTGHLIPTSYWVEDWKLL